MAGPGGKDTMFDPRDFLAQHTQGSRYGLPWAQWYVSGGKQGEEPPGEPEAAHEALRRGQATADVDQQGKIMHRSSS